VRVRAVTEPENGLRPLLISANVFGPAPVLTEAMLTEFLERAKAERDAPPCGSPEHPHLMGSRPFREDWPYASCLNCGEAVMLRPPTHREMRELHRDVLRALRDCEGDDDEVDEET
jgi:hypothetical protein